MKTARDWAICAALAIAAAAYAPVVQYGFINNFDDPPYVTQNPWIQKGLSGDGEPEATRHWY